MDPNSETTMKSNDYNIYDDIPFWNIPSTSMFIVLNEH